MQRKWILTFFFLAGISSLIYEIAWVRQATLTFGVSIYAYSAVLTAYMGGMALGSWWIGQRADQTTTPMRLFAFLQFGLAGLGLLAPFLLQGLSYLYASLVRSIQPTPGLLTILRLLMAMTALTPPAALIGAAFPVAARIYARRDGQIGGDTGWLYALNTLGSVLGCLLTAAFLLQIFGLLATIFLAALLNLLVGTLAMGANKSTTATPEKAKSTPSRRTRKHGPQSQEQTISTTSSPNSTLAANFLLWAYAISGFAAMAYEVAWARLIALHTVGAVYSFSLMLAVFLTGLAVGGMAGTAWMRHRKAIWKHFALIQAGIGLLAILSLFIFAQLPHLRLENFFTEYSVAAEMLFEALLSFITLFPVTLLIGLAFPVVSSLYTTEQAAGIGFRLSRLSAANTLGSILGSLLGGFVILPALGLQLSIFALAGLNLIIGLASAWLFAAGSRTRVAVSSLALLAILASAIQPRMQYLGYWQDIANQLIFYKEGVESSVAVFSASATNPKFSTVNGRVEVPTDELSMRAFYLLGHLPPLIKPDAQRALMLSFGNGIATGALASHHIPNIEVVELAQEQIDAARSVYTEENRGVLDYHGLTVHIEDARNFLLQTDRHYDIITTDATHPSNSCSWALFTVEFYRHIRQHLTEDGIFLQWVPIHSLAIADYKSILRTYQSVFPYATLWYTGGSHTLVLGTLHPLTPAELDQKLANLEGQVEVLVDLGNAPNIKRHWIMNSDQLAQFAGEGHLVTDDRAYFLPINRDQVELIQTIQQAAMQANP